MWALIDVQTFLLFYYNCFRQTNDCKGLTSLLCQTNRNTTMDFVVQCFIPLPGVLYCYRSAFACILKEVREGNNTKTRKLNSTNIFLTRWSQALICLSPVLVPDLLRMALSCRTIDGRLAHGNETWGKSRYWLRHQIGLDARVHQRSNNKTLS